MQPLFIAAPASGHGKTTVTLALLAALRRRGVRVAPFKVGPDFIDPGHHAAVAGRPSYNLDGWICPEGQVRASFAHGCRGAELAVIEGVMGLFDGAAGDAESGSTAEIARWLGGRIVLVVDVARQARSVAALVKGFADFDPRLEFAGVILNRVASANHEALLRAACAATPGLPPLLGCLRREPALALPERHLGLVTADEQPFTPEQLGHLADWLEAGVALDSLWSPAGPHGQRQPVPDPGSSALRPPRQTGGAPVRIGLARDEAFCFYYPENLERLQAAGAELVEFSPLRAARLPEGLDGLYLGGGYPELHAARLAANSSLRGEIRRRAEAGLPVYAECGGLIYLAESLDGQPMCGLFPAAARLLPRRQALGYREVVLAADGPLGPAGTTLRGHEFHYSELALPAAVARVYRVRDRTGRELAAEGFRRGNVLASYIHLHFGSAPSAAAAFTAFCRQPFTSQAPQATDPAREQR